MLQDITHLRERSDEVTTSIRDVSVCCLIIIIIFIVISFSIKTLLKALSLSPTTDNTYKRPRSLYVQFNCLLEINMNRT